MELFKNVTNAKELRDFLNTIDGDVLERLSIVLNGDEWQSDVTVEAVDIVEDGALVQMLRIGPTEDE